MEKYWYSYIFLCIKTLWFHFNGIISIVSLLSWFYSFYLFVCTKYSMAKTSIHFFDTQLLNQSYNGVYYVCRFSETGCAHTHISTIKDRKHHHCPLRSYKFSLNLIRCKIKILFMLLEMMIAFCSYVGNWNRDKHVFGETKQQEHEMNIRIQR